MLFPKRKLSNKIGEAPFQNVPEEIRQKIWLKLHKENSDLSHYEMLVRYGFNAPCVKIHAFTQYVCEFDCSCSTGFYFYFEKSKHLLLPCPYNITHLNMYTFYLNRVYQTTGISLKGSACIFSFHFKIKRNLILHVL